MRENRYTQMLAIEGKDPQDVAIKFNQAMISLKNDNPTYQMVSPTLFYIYYVECEQVAENKAEEYSLKGCNDTCKNCQHFCPHKTVKGNIDKRAKIGTCTKTSTPTFRDSAACDLFYEELEQRYREEVENAEC